MAFAHLHVHSRYSVFDGVADIDALFKRARSLGQPGLALTDHGALYGIPEFLSISKNYPGVKPIVGCEIYLTDHYDHKIKNLGHRKVFHLTLLAKNLAGYWNLVKIVTIGNIEGEYYGKPRISHDVLAAHHEGLIALSGCMAGEIPQAVLHDDLDKAVAAIEWYREVFGDDFYLEVMSHKWSKSGKGHNLKEMQDKVNAVIFDLAEKYSVDVVVTNDVHFVLKKDAVLQDVMIEEYIYKDLHKGEKYSPLYTGEEYIKSEKQMLTLFPDHPEAVSNTMKVLDKVERYSIECPPELPDYPVPDNCSQFEYLEHLCTAALTAKGCDDEAHWSRLESEFRMVKELGYTNYFLILCDLFQAVRENGGVISSSFCEIFSSLINYLLDITEIDPIKYGLNERFLNDSDSNYPILWLILDKEGSRESAINHLKCRYGNDNVAKVVRFIGFDREDKVKINQVLKKYKISSDCENKLIYTIHSTVTDYGKEILLSKKPISEYVPITSDSSDNDIVSQYTGLIETGPVIFCFVQSALLELIGNVTRECNIDYHTIPLDDEMTFALFSEGRTDDIFCFSDKDSIRMLHRVKPDNFQKLALSGILSQSDKFPGLMSHYIDPSKISYPLSGISDILDDTYGVLVYEEQLMQIVQRIAGFTPGESERLMASVGNWIKEDLFEMKRRFISGGIANGYTEEELAKFWAENLRYDLSASFLDKSFFLRNIYFAYLCGYLKAHFPETYQKHRKKYPDHL